MRLDHVTLLVADLDAAAAFYEDLLDLQRGEAATRPDPGNKLWLFDAQGNAMLHLVRADTVAENGGSIDHFALSVRDLRPFAKRAAMLGATTVRQAFAGSGIEQLVVGGPHGVRIELAALRRRQADAAPPTR